MKAIGFGGPFLGGHKLIVHTTHAEFDGQAILANLGDSFNQAGISAKYDTIGATMQKGREGMGMHVVHLTLPQGVSVQINRWMQPDEGEYINAKINMAPVPGIDGHCGNFNGNPVDDD